MKTEWLYLMVTMKEIQMTILKKNMIRMGISEGLVKLGSEIPSRSLCFQITTPGGRLIKSE